MHAHPTHPIFKQHKISIRRISAEIGWSYQHVANVLTGVSRPSAGMNAALHRYARQVDPSFFIPSETIL